MLRIDYKTGATTQLSVPYPKNLAADALRISGPAVGRAPDGSIWISQLGSYNALVRISPDTHERTLYQFGGPSWAKTIRLIHIAFSSALGADRHNRIYALASDLLDDEAVNALVVLRMTDDWRTCLGRRVLPLPTQDCNSHRVAFVDPHSIYDCEVARNVNRSVIISEMASSKLLQIKTQNLIKLSLMKEHKETDENGFEVRSYTVEREEEGDAC